MEATRIDVWRIATRNWHNKGIKKGEPLRFVCGHHRRGLEQSREEKIKRVKSWGVNDVNISPYLPNNKVIRYHPEQKRWYCSCGNGSSKPHARAVYEYYFGPIPIGSVVHHKSGTAISVEDDKPDNLMLVSHVWNLHYFPRLAHGFEVPEKIVTDCYIKAIRQHPQDKVFMEVCKMLIEYKENNSGE